MWNNNKSENGDEKKKRRRCRQQTKRRLEKIGDARAATLIVRLCSLLCSFLVFARIFFLLVSCARVCVRHPRNRKQISRISHSHSYDDHTNAFLVQRRRKKQNQKRRKLVIEITFDVSTFVRCMSVTPKCGTGISFIWSAGVRQEKARMTKPSKSSYSTNWRFAKRDKRHDR